MANATRPGCGYCGSKDHGTRLCPRVKRHAPQDMDRAAQEALDRTESARHRALRVVRGGKR